VEFGCNQTSHPQYTKPFDMGMSQHIDYPAISIFYIKFFRSSHFSICPFSLLYTYVYYCRATT